MANGKTLPPPQASQAAAKEIVTSHMPNVEAAILVDHKDILDRIVELGRDSRAAQIIELTAPEGATGVPSKIHALAMFDENSVHIKNIDPFFEPYRTAPKLRKGTATVTTLESFCALANRHKDEHSVIFAKTAWPSPSLTAVMDYHQTDGAPRFGTHRIHYAFPLTDEFKVWMEFNGKLIEQREFALFLEEHAAELSSPFDAERGDYERLFKERFADPIELINLSRNLEIYVGSKIKRAERLQTGERTIQFETQHTNASGEPVDIPGIFMISVAAFMDGSPIRIPARLRYRTTGSEIKWGYQLYRPEHWLRVQVQEDLAEAAKATGLPTYEGAPEQ
jgi:uncharacterized protein YfdQ (DUF2303 family)